MSKGIPVLLLTSQAQVPTYGSEHAAGMDLYAAIDGDAIEIPAKGRAMIPTGVAMAMPVGHYGRIAPRSGLAAKHGLDVLAGVIDCDYRGEIRVVLHNTSDTPYYVNNGERVAQMILAPYVKGEFVTVGTLEESERGEGGFGSTGA